MTKRAKPVVHARDHEHGGADPHRVHYEDVGGAGGGGQAILYDTYPQSGGYIAADTAGGGIAFKNTDTGDNAPVTLTNQDDGGIQLLDEGDGAGINIESSHSALIFIQQSGTGNIQIGVVTGNIELSTSSGLIVLSGLPTTDPGFSGALWNSGGTLRIS